MCFFFFNDTATTEIYTLPLHDALPILFQVKQLTRQPVRELSLGERMKMELIAALLHRPRLLLLDRKSTRLNSSHANISYAVFCLKKKNTTSPSLHSLSFLVTSRSNPLL